MTSQVQDILDRNRSLSTRRDVWRTLWQDLADIYFPNRGGFINPLVPGQESQIEIYDTTPMQARRGLATAIDGLMKPATARWFWLKARDERLNEVEEAKRWFDGVQDRMWTAIYDPEARFIQQSGAVDNDLSTFGLGYLWMGENRRRDGLIFRSLHIGDCSIDENADGQVDTIFITRRWTPRQAQQRFGDNIPPKVKEALAPGGQSKRDHLFEFVQAIYPREDRDTRYRDSKNMPFANCIVSVDDETLVEESGFQEFPVAVPRWEVAAGEIYPRSPGMIGLPDSRTLQAMGHTLLVGGQRAVDPPHWIANDAAMSAVRSFPGGLTVVDAEVVARTGGKPMGALESGANIPVGREMQDDYRQLVLRAFFKDIFTLPHDQEMTATEVVQRKEEFLRTIGPTLGQLENDYIGAVIRRVFGIMLRANALPPAPDVLAGQDAEFEFMSPIQQAKRQLETANMSQAFAFIEPVIQLRPNAVDNIDIDEIVRDLPDAFSLPHKWIKAKDDVEAMRAQQAQAIQSAGALQEGQQAADIVKTAADAGHANAKAKAELAAVQPPPGQSGFMTGPPFQPQAPMLPVGR